jgi:hypothetical protein
MFAQSPLCPSQPANILQFLLSPTQRDPELFLFMGCYEQFGNFHMDPMGSEAANMLFHGEKVWLIFPSETIALLSAKGKLS